MNLVAIRIEIARLQPASKAIWRMSLIRQEPTGPVEHFLPFSLN